MAQVFRLEKITWHPKHKGQSREVVYGLTSLLTDKGNPDKLFSLLCQYWGIEAGSCQNSATGLRSARNAVR